MHDFNPDINLDDADLDHAIDVHCDLPDCEPEFTLVCGHCGVLEELGTGDDAEFPGKSVMYRNNVRKALAIEAEDYIHKSCGGEAWLTIR